MYRMNALSDDYRKTGWNISITHQSNHDNNSTEIAISQVDQFFIRWLSLYDWYAIHTDMFACDSNQIQINIHVRYVELKFVRLDRQMFGIFFRNENQTQKKQLMAVLLMQ